MEIYDFEVKCADGSRRCLGEYRGRVLLIVNTAGRCGFTPQYRQLEDLYLKFQSRGLEVLAFPCNQFLGQEPGSDSSIQKFCSLNYGVTFPVFAKIKVNGPDADPLFQWLKAEKSGFPGRMIKWNFTKFLVARDGRVRGRYAPATAPFKMTADIEKLLEEKGIGADPEDR